MNKLQGKVAVIIGGSTGIGLASAKEFTNEEQRWFSLHATPATWTKQ